MYGKPVQVELRRGSGRPRKTWPYVGALAVVLLVSSTLLLAKLISVSLEKLVDDSDLIAYGHTVGGTVSSAPGGPRTVSFEVASFLKEMGLSGRKRVRLCNDPEDVESYNLSKVEGAYVVFAKSSGTCFRPVLGLRSVVQTDGHFALTGNIAGQPERQEISSFLAKVKSLVLMSSRRS
jgi:hypothetical protein